jgi:hypothetical protein
MGIKGEPSTPNDPAHGQVWSAIIRQIDQADSESEFVSVGDTPRSTFARHPWSIGGGGAADLYELMELERQKLSSAVQSIGITSFTLEDEVFLNQHTAFTRAHVPADLLRISVSGEELRDWQRDPCNVALFPYDKEFRPLDLPSLGAPYRYMWPYRATLSNNKMFGKQTKVEAGLKWWEFGRLTATKLRDPLSITFAFVATHNHFVLERDRCVFNRSAPVVKLPSGASEDSHLGLLGLLNSSIACFWCQQVMHNKGGPGGGSSKDEKWHDFFEFAGTALAEFPLAVDRPIDLAQRLDRLATELSRKMPAAILMAGGANTLPDRALLNTVAAKAASLRRQMVAWQEELDWRCYALYGMLRQEDLAAVTHAAPPEVAPGQRAFEIVLARRVSAGTLETRWFEWLQITPTIELPAHWQEDYRRVVERRIELIEKDRNIGLIENMNCKRRWETRAWSDMERSAARDWLLDRLEAPHLWPAGVDQPPQLSTVNRLADAVRADVGFMQIAELYAGHSGFDVGEVVAELVAAESVPFLPVLRYSDTGLRKRAQWEDTWALQRREDAGERVGKIPVPPKYQSKDFLKADFWRLRGGLDVPKERWVSYPGCERGADTSLPIAWAGWNHLQQATALAAYYLEMKENEGWEPVRLQPLLAGLLELVPWLEQWHNEIDPAYGERMGTYYRSFVNEEARALGFTLDDLRTWKPAVTGAKRGRKKAAQLS